MERFDSLMVDSRVRLSATAAPFLLECLDCCLSFAFRLKCESGQMSYLICHCDALQLVAYASYAFGMDHAIQSAEDA